MWVYQIYEKDTLEVLYVGKTFVSLKDRFSSHLSNARTRGQSPFHMYINTIGENAIDIAEIDTASNRKELLAKERKWIKEICPPFNINSKPNPDKSGIKKWMKEPDTTIRTSE